MMTRHPHLDAERHAQALDHPDAMVSLEVVLDRATDAELAEVGIADRWALREDDAAGVWERLQILWDEKAAAEADDYAARCAAARRAA